jgi:ribosomal protein L7/L12
MVKLNQISDLTDTEADQLWRKLNEILELSDQMAEGGASRGHQIYKLARDCRDMLMFDQQSRDVVRKLTVQETYAGLHLDATVKALVKDNRNIEAIKELRTQTGCSLKEAKDAVEAYINKTSVAF